MTTTTASTNPQHMDALRRGNRIRIAAAENRRWIAEGRLSIIDVLDPETPIPEPLESTTIGRLLLAQRRWGPTRVRRFLLPFAIRENRRLCDLTARQRAVLVAALRDRHEAAA